MMKSYLVLSLMAVALISPIVAQDESIPEGTIHGHVYDTDTKQPLSGAFVYCHEISAKDATDKNGYYAIEGVFLKLKTYNIECTKYEYESAKMTITTDTNGKAEAKFYLKSSIRDVPVSAGIIYCSGNNCPPRSEYNISVICSGITGEPCPPEATLCCGIDCPPESVCVPLEKTCQASGGIYQNIPCFVTPMNLTPTATIKLLWSVVSQPLAKYAISGRVFNDVNDNGRFDAKETGLADWAVFLENPAGNTITSATTAMDGAYAFTDLLASDYIVDLALPVGWELVAPLEGKHLVTVTDANVAGLDFAVRVQLMAAR